jgi:uncharacterized membrane protein YdjX (TVP38/TMEM64 family)
MPSSSPPASQESDTEPPASTKQAGSKRLTIALVALAIGALFLGGRQAAALLPQFSQWVADLGPWGPIVFILGYATAVVAFVPGSVLTLAAGAIFGLGKGTVIAFSAATAGACAAFLVSRYLARDRITALLQDRDELKAIDKAVQQQGGRIVFLLRLSPLFPFSLLNYALGLTGVRFASYALASVGMLPGTILYVYYGKLAGDVAALAANPASSNDPAQWAVSLIGLAATVLVTAKITNIARRALAEASANDQ